MRRSNFQKFTRMERRYREMGWSGDTTWKVDGKQKKYRKWRESEMNYLKDLKFYFEKHTNIPHIRVVLKSVRM
jgi:hypothetical protein